MRPERAAASVAEKLRVTFDLVETGLALQRQNIRRRHPAASEAEIDRRFDEWLGDRPPDRTGPAAPIFLQISSRSSATGAALPLAP